MPRAVRIWAAGIPTSSPVSASLVGLERESGLLYDSTMGIDVDLPMELRDDVRTAARILIEEGCREVYLFGSVAAGTFTDESDIDLATVGLSKERFFTAYGRVLAKVRRAVDLVALDYDHDFGHRLREAGTLTRVA